MNIRLHANATTTPKTRAYIQASDKSVRALAAERAGLLTLLGDRALKERVPAWLRGSPIARKGEVSLAQDPT